MCMRVLCVQFALLFYLYADDGDDVADGIFEYVCEIQHPQIIQKSPQTHFTYAALGRPLSVREDAFRGDIPHTHTSTLVAAAAGNRIANAKTTDQTHTNRHVHSKRS